MKIFFIRHGESINNVFEENFPDQYYNLRVPDPELSDLGLSQALNLKRFFFGTKIDKGMS